MLGFGVGRLSDLHSTQSSGRSWMRNIHSLILTVMKYNHVSFLCSSEAGGNTKARFRAGEKHASNEKEKT